jgi:hypothetical protein
MNFGSDALKKKVIPDVLAGKKFISLAISEAFAGSSHFWPSRSDVLTLLNPTTGSDVAGLQCTAKKTEDGKHYIVVSVVLSSVDDFR